LSLFRKKSIDALIAACEDPSRKLKRTLGPWSLTSLGIGAVIGSGIFTVIGTAIAGQKFDTSSILIATYLAECLACIGACCSVLRAGRFTLSAGACPLDWLGLLPESRAL